MSTKNSHSQMVGRRGELIVELFLQDLEPAFIAQSPPDIAYDFFVGFPNSEGGINTCGVEVKSTERPVRGEYQVSAKVYERLAHSNIPVLLLIVDVKDNRLYYAWPTSEGTKPRSDARVARVPVIEVDDAARIALRSQLAGNR